MEYSYPSTNISSSCDDALMIATSYPSTSSYYSCDVNLHNSDFLFFYFLFFSYTAHHNNENLTFICSYTLMPLVTTKTLTSTCFKRLSILATTPLLSCVMFRIITITFRFVLVQTILVIITLSPLLILF